MKSLEVTLDASLNMDAQVSSVGQSAIYHLTSWDFVIVIYTMVTSRLDYTVSNSLYTELPLNLTQKLQQVQNMAAHMLTALFA